jgi:AraC-like DNA-binding protein
MTFVYFCFRTKDEVMGKSNLDLRYLLVNEQDRRFGLWVNTVGYESIAPKTAYPLRDHPTGYFFNPRKGRVLHEYQVLYITEGKGAFTSDSTPATPIGKGSVMILFPGQWHTYKPLHEVGWDEYFIGFEGPFADRVMQQPFLDRERQTFEIGLNEELVSLFSRALIIAREDKISAQQYLSGIVCHILGLILSVSRNKRFEIGEVDQKIEQAKIIMNGHLSGNIDLEAMAGQLNLSYSWFRKVFKNYTGYAPAKYFQEIKLRKAKELLVTTSLSAKEISFMLGYQSTEHFFSLFKRHTTFTPLEYRAFARGEGETRFKE